MNELEQRVFKLIATQLDVAIEKVTHTAEFVRDLGADSLDLVELVMSFEEAFGIEISDDMAEQIRCVQDVLQLAIVKS